jgi:hypothetical protein
LHAGFIPPGGFRDMPIPHGALATGKWDENILEFIWPDARQPDNGDTRILAFAFRALKLS